MIGVERLSINEASFGGRRLKTAVDAVARAGVASIGVWRDQLQEAGVAVGARYIRDAGLRVSSLCRAGFFVQTDAAARERQRQDNARAIDEAAAIGTGVLVLVVGPGLPGATDESLRVVIDGISDMLPLARAAGVHLGLEPFHPMLLAERSVIVTLAQANDVVEQVGDPFLGIVVDLYHVWWDAHLPSELNRAHDRVVGLQLADWLVPTTSLLAGRGLPGDGVIPLRALCRVVDDAGYRGPIEVEVINRSLRRRPARSLAAEIRSRFEAFVADRPPEIGDQPSLAR